MCENVLFVINTQINHNTKSSFGDVLDIYVYVWSMFKET